ncbi:MAG: FAD:protein FMN transferase [Planctomycetaceae bacterium]|nr:MAG: FAD:protein FMN transferase [Planctomycetaceae bacterium]
MQSGPSLTGMTMGTIYSVKLAKLPAGIEVDTLHRKVEQRLQQINALMSTYQEDSELSRFNRYQHDDWFEVSSETAGVVNVALEISQLTDGAFDVTVGPLVNLWNFGPDPKLGQMPTAEQVEQQRARVGYQQLDVRLSPPALRKKNPEIYVDLSAIAKGYGVDAIAELLADRGITDFMIEIGGDVRTGGTRHDGQRWRIGIEKPIDHVRSVQQIVGLSGQSLATSGDYRNVFEHEGRRYSHAIDPSTGYPVHHELASVSVIHDHCMMADAWATALLVAGPDAALQLAQDHSLDVLLILRTEQGFEERMTDGFSRFLQTNR